MQHSKFTATCPIKNWLVLKSFKTPKMESSISKRSTVKASTAKPLGNPPPRDISFGPETAIRFYVTEDDDKNKEGENI